MKNTPYAILDFITPQQNGPGSVENDSIPRDLKLTHLPRACEDCGEETVNRTTLSRKHIQPYTHWRTNCKNCNLYKHPLTGEFDSTRSEIDAYYKESIKKQKLNTKDK